MVCLLAGTIHFMTITVCSYKIYKFLKIQRRTSVNRKRYNDIQGQITKALMAQATIPMVFIFIPLTFFTICIHAPFEINPEVSTIAALLFEYLPIMNASSILFFVKVYRSQVIMIFKGKFPNIQVSSSKDMRSVTKF